MNITFQCPHCGTGLSMPSDHAGKKARCGGCGAVIVVPRQAAAVSRPQRTLAAPPPSPLTPPPPRKRSNAVLLVLGASGAGLTLLVALVVFLLTGPPKNNRPADGRAPALGQADEGTPFPAETPTSQADTVKLVGRCEARAVFLGFEPPEQAARRVLQQFDWAVPQTVTWTAGGEAGLLRFNDCVRNARYTSQLRAELTRAGFVVEGSSRVPLRTPEEITLEPSEPIPWPAWSDDLEPEAPTTPQQVPVYGVVSVQGRKLRELEHRKEVLRAALRKIRGVIAESLVHEEKEGFIDTFRLYVSSTMSPDSRYLHAALGAAGMEMAGTSTERYQRKRLVQVGPDGVEPPAGSPPAAWADAGLPAMTPDVQSSIPLSASPLADGPPDPRDQRVAAGHHTAKFDATKVEPLNPVVWEMSPDPPNDPRAHMMPEQVKLDLPVLLDHTVLVRTKTPSPFIVAYCQVPRDCWRFGLIDLRSGKMTKQFTLAVDTPIRSVAPNADGRRVGILTGRGPIPLKAEVWDFDTGERIWAHPMGLWPGANDNGLFSFAGPERLIYAVAIARGMKFHCVDAGTGDSLVDFSTYAPIAQHSGRCVVSPGGRYLAVGTNDAMHAWDLTTGELVAQIGMPFRPEGLMRNAFFDSLNGIAFTEDGRRLIVTRGIRPPITIHTWDIEKQGPPVSVECALPTSFHAAVWNVPLQQIPGTDFWVHYSDAVIHPLLPAAIGTIDPERRIPTRKRQFPLNAQTYLTRRWSPELSGWITQAAPLPVDRMAAAERALALAASRDE